MLRPRFFPSRPLYRPVTATSRYRSDCPRIFAGFRQINTGKTPSSCEAQHPSRRPEPNSAPSRTPTVACAGHSDASTAPDLPLEQKILALAKEFRELVRRGGALDPRLPHSAHVAHLSQGEHSQVKYLASRYFAETFCRAPIRPGSLRIATKELCVHLCQITSIMNDGAPTLLCLGPWRVVETGTAFFNPRVCFRDMRKSEQYILNLASKAYRMLVEERSFPSNVLLVMVTASPIQFTTVYNDGLGDCKDLLVGWTEDCPGGNISKWATEHSPR
ncbi:hypothetical protein PG987_015479 [Apiospora arundinis]